MIDVEAFELIEDGEVSGVDFVAAVGGAGGDDADGEFFDGLHGADLDAGSVGAEKATVVEVKSVALVTGGMVGGGVEGVKAVPFGLDLGSFSEGEAHAAEGGDGEVADLREGVEGAGALAGAAGQGEIESGDRGGILGGLKGGFFGVDAVGDGGADFVEFSSDVFFEVRRHILHSGAEGGELAFFAEVVDAKGFERGLVAGSVERGEGFGMERGEVGEHRLLF